MGHPKSNCSQAVQRARELGREGFAGHSLGLRRPNRPLDAPAQPEPVARVEGEQAHVDRPSDQFDRLDYDEESAEIAACGEDVEGDRAGDEHEEPIECGDPRPPLLGDDHARSTLSGQPLSTQRGGSHGRHEDHEAPRDPPFYGEDRGGVAEELDADRCG